jgi:L-idonate 5-dehydrogenase
VTLPSESLVVTHAADDLRVEPVTLREPAADDEAVVEVAFGGIYGPDLHYWIHGAAGESILRAPMVLGHEVVGTVAQAAGEGSGPAPATLWRFTQPPNGPRDAPYVDEACEVNGSTWHAS